MGAPFKVDQRDVTGLIDLNTTVASHTTKIASFLPIAMGTTAALSGTPGTITVTPGSANAAAVAASAAITANAVIVLTRASAVGTLGHLSVGTRTSGTSFVITSSGNETSTVHWVIYPAPPALS